MFKSTRIPVIVVAALVAAVALVGMPAPRPAESAPLGQAGAGTPTATPTRRPGSVARLLLRGANSKSPDGAGSDITANVVLPPDGLWQGQAFEFQLIEGASPSVEFAVFKRDPASDARVEVYRHVERNPPWCLFGDADGKCNSMPLVGGQFRWPDSDDAPGSGRPVESGDYVMEVIATGNLDLGGGSWRKREAEDNAIYFAIDQTFDVPLPRQVGRAALLAPPSGSAVSGVVVVRGTATSNNFAYYKFELLDPRCANGVCFLREFRRPVANGVLWRWDTREPLPNGVVLPNGTWTMQLVVVDRWERPLPDKPAVTFTLQN